MASASPLFQLSSDGGSTYLDPGVAMADAEALAYSASGTYSIKAKLDSTAGVGPITWQVIAADDEHNASRPAVTPNSDKSCTLSVPKTGGAWLLRVTINGGIDQTTGDPDLTLLSTLAIKVRTSVGQQLLAVGETTEAGSLGWLKAYNDLARALAANVSSTTRDVLYCENGSVVAPTVYTTLADAYQAAQALPGAVTLQLLGATATIDSALDLENRISLVGVGGSKVDVLIEGAGQLTNVDGTKVENLAITSSKNTDAAIVLSGKLLMNNASATSSGTEPAIGVAAGGTLYLNHDSSLKTGTTEVVKVLGGTLNAYVDGTSEIESNTLKSSGGTTINASAEPGGKIGAQPNVDGTLVQDTALEPWVFEVDDCFSDPDELPAILDGFRVAEVPCRVTKVTAFRGDKGAGGTTSVQGQIVTNSGASDVLTASLDFVLADGDDVTKDTADFANDTLAEGDRFRVVVTDVEDAEDDPEGPSNLWVRVERVKVSA